MQRRSFLALSAAAAAGTVLPAFSRSRSEPGTILPWDALGEGVFVSPPEVSGGNALIVVGDERTLVVDTKFAFLGRAIAADARAVGEGRPLVLVNTHHHGDHTGGNAAFGGSAERWGHTALVARVESQLDNFKQQAAGGPRQARAMMPENERLLDLALETTEGADTLSRDDFVPQKTMRGAGTRIRLGGIAAGLRHRGRGHTDNDLIVRIADRNVLHTGDLVFNGFHPFFDASGGVEPRGWIRSLEAAYAMCDAETVVVPGHGPRGTRELITEQIAYHEALIDAVGELVASGVPRDEATQASFPFFGNRGFSQLAPIGIGVVYDVLTQQSERDQ